MQTLAAGLDHFVARELVDRCFVMWTLNYRDGAFHSYHDVPHILWGGAGGWLKQNQHIQVNATGGTTNNQLLNALISAGVQDTGQIVDDFGEGTPGLTRRDLGVKMPLAWALPHRSLGAFR